MKVEGLIQEGTDLNNIEVTGTLGDQVSKSEAMISESKQYIETRRQMFESVLAIEDAPEEMKEEARKYLEQTNEMSNLMEETAEQFQKIMEEQNKLLHQMQQEYRREDIIEYAKAIRDRAVEENSLHEVDQADKLIKEMENGVSLEILFTNLYEVKNVSNLINIAKNDKEFNKLWKKYTDRLKNNANYMFRDPSHMLADLTAIYGNELDAKIFLVSYCKFFSMQKRIDDLSVLINELSRNIANINNEKFLERNILVDNLKEYVQYIKEQ